MRLPGPAALRRFRAAVRRWGRRHGRDDLPWRRTRDPWAVLVSEIMLQQTQVRRVAPAFRRFLRKYPTAARMARSPVGAVLRDWAGLGYNRRALALHRTARELTARHGGKVPSGVAALEVLPGIGPYTARAVASFAFGAREAVVDTNIHRVIARALLGTAPGDRAEVRHAAAETAVALIQGRDARRWNLTLMDLGAMVCTANAPACPTCPVQSQCRALADGVPLRAPPGRATPFRGSTRFVRGRVLALLRTLTPGSTISEAALRDRLGRVTGIGPLDRLPTLLRGLADDGLLVIRTRGDGRRVGMPGEER